MQKCSSGEGLNILGSSKGCNRGCMCQTCRLARAEKISPRKHRLYDDNVMRPFEVISTDIKGPLMESRGGMRYSVVFIDQFSRYAKTYYMKRPMHNINSEI